MRLLWRTGLFALCAILVACSDGTDLHVDLGRSGSDLGQPTPDLGPSPDSCPTASICGGTCCGPDESCDDGVCKVVLPDCVEPAPCPLGDTCDFSTLRVVDQATADSVRQAMIDHIWKGQGFPSSRMPDSVDALSLAQSPISGVENLAALTQFTVTMPLTPAEGGGAFTSKAIHFQPVTRVDRLFIFHQGHTGKLYAYGGDTTIRYLVKHGYDVVGLLMPLVGINTGPPGYLVHDDMEPLESSTRCFLQFFLEPVAAVINHLQAQHTYKDVSMIGISGGGWTTTLYAAADPRVGLSFPVAGSLPLDLPDSSSLGDAEQNHPELFVQVASYRDLYVLGGAGKGRAQVQVLNRDDSCCFSGVTYRAYENRIRALARTLGGSFDVYLDASHGIHMISPHVLEVVVGPRIEGKKVWILEENDNGYGYPGSVYGATYLSGIWSPLALDVGSMGAFSSTADGSGADAVWTFGHIAPGTYRVSVTWPPSPNHASDALFVVFGGANPLGSYHFVNQQVAPADLTTMGAEWADLGQSQVITGDTLSVWLTSATSGDVVADAVRIEQLSLGTPLCK